MTGVHRYWTSLKEPVPVPGAVAVAVAVEVLEGVAHLA